MALGLVFAGILPAMTCHALNFYVNDSFTNGDVYSGIPGNDEFFGIEHCTNHNGQQCAKTSVDAILDEYFVGPGDTILIDTGVYFLTNNIDITVTNSGTPLNPFVIQGSTNFAAGGTVISRGSTGAGAYCFHIKGAGYVEFRDLDLRSGYAVIMLEDCVSCVLSNVVLSGGAKYGCLVQTSGGIRIVNSRIVSNAGKGIWNNSATTDVSFAVIADNSGAQLDVGRGLVSVSNSIIASSISNAICINVSGGTYAGDYNDIYATNGAIFGYYMSNIVTVADWQNCTGQDLFSLTHNPLFADRAGGDYHLKSRTGRYMISGIWTNDTVQSPCIDAGDPLLVCTNEPDPNGSVVNIGMCGNTAKASLSNTNAWLLALSYNNGGTMRGTSIALRWVSNLTNALDTVKLEYLQDPLGSNWLTIASNVPAAARSYSWDATGFLGSPSARWRVVSEADTNIWDATDWPFALRPFTFYVNDSITNGDQFCSAAGSALNWGASPDRPAASLQAILDRYDLEYGDVVYVDNGTYSLSDTIVIGKADSGSSNGVVSFVGGTNTVLSRQGSISSSVGMKLDSVSFVTISNLTFKNGYHGVKLLNCRECSFGNVSVLSATNIGFRVEGSSNCVFSSMRVLQSFDDAASLYNSPSNTFSNCLMAGAAGRGLSLSSSLGTLVSGCTIGWNQKDQIQSSSSSLALSNSIIAASGPGTYCVNSSGGGYTGDYNDLFASGGAMVGAFGSVRATISDWQASTLQDAHSFNHDPLFANPAGLDFHLKSVEGRYFAGAWVTDAVHSPCIDTGNPLASFVDEPVPNGSRVNLGAYGNTPEASLGQTNSWLLALNANDQPLVRGPFSLRWTGGALVPGETVNVDYSADGGGSWVNLGTVLAATESYAWDTSPVGSSSNMLWRVSLVSGTATSIVEHLFAVNPTVFYVNDGSTNGDVYCTGAGSVTNRGFRPDGPIHSLEGLLAVYTLMPGDTVYIDTGYYLLTNNLVMGPETSGSLAGGYVKIIGSTNYPAGGTAIRRTSVISPAYGLNFTGAGYFDLSHLSITGGYHSVLLRNSDHILMDDVTLGGAGDAALRFEYASNCVASHCLMWNSQNGISAGLGTATNLVEFCTVAGNLGKQIEIKIGGLSISNSIVQASRSSAYCMYLYSGAAGYSGDYNDLIASNGAVFAYNGGSSISNLLQWQGTRGVDLHSLSCEPLFASPATGDFHVRSAVGRYSRLAGVWQQDLLQSPCIDTADSNVVVNEPDPNGGVANIGAFGNTMEASMSTSQWILVTSLNDGGSVRGNVKLDWKLSSNITDTVRLEYAVESNSAWVVIATNVAAADMTYTWNATGWPGSPHARWRVVRESDTNVWDASDGTFELRPFTFYVNDGSTAGDVYCSAPGSIANSGVASNMPLDTLKSVIETYDLEAGDTVYIDTGYYSSPLSTTIGLRDGGASNAYVSFIGSTNTAAGGSVIYRSANSSGICGLQFTSASYIFVSDLVFTGGFNGISLTTSDHIEINKVKVVGASSDGIKMDGGKNNQVLMSEISHCRGAGIYISSPNGVCSNNVVWTNSLGGIVIKGLSNIVANCTVSGNLSNQVSILSGSVKADNNIIVCDQLGRYCVYLASGVGYSGDYNDLWTTNGGFAGYYGKGLLRLEDWQAATLQDSDSIANYPMFADPVAGDFHLRSMEGRLSSGAWVTDAVQSPCIDAGPAFGAVTNELPPNGGRINLGCYGNTAQASKSLTNDWLTVVGFNAGGIMRGNSVALRWLAGENVAGSVDLLYSLDAGASWSNLATALAQDQNYVWNVGAFTNFSDAKWQVRLSATPSVMDESDLRFGLNTLSFYVNDSSTNGDIFCTAPGSLSNDGLSPDRPLDSLQSLLTVYNLAPGCTVYVDTGVYRTDRDIEIGTNNAGLPGQYVTVQGSTNGSIIGLASHSLILSSVHDVYLRDLVVTGGVKGVFLNVVDSCILSNITVRNMSADGVNLYKSPNCSLFDVASSNNIGYGVYLSGSHAAVVSDGVFSQNKAGGFFALASHGSSINRCTMKGNVTDGIALQSSHTTLVSRCVVRDNKGAGISCSGSSNTIQYSILMNNTNNQVKLLNGSTTFNYNIASAGRSNNYVVYYSGGSYDGDYNDLLASNGAKIGYFSGFCTNLVEWQAKSGRDTFSISLDPLFADAAGGDYHLKSIVGRYLSGTWTNDLVHSPCIDAGPVFTNVTLEPIPNGGRINIGMYGDSAEASMSISNNWLIAMTYNDGGTARGTVPLRWRSGMTNLAAEVSIEYSRTAGATWDIVATNIPATNGVYYWDTSLVLGSPHAMWRLYSGSVTSEVYSTFYVRPLRFYVNDSSTNGDVYCTAAGSAGAIGIESSQPASSVSSILSSFDLDYGDTIFVDTGTYNFTNTLTVASSQSGSALAPVMIVGSTNASAGGTAFWLAATNIPVVLLDGPSYFQLSNVSLTGGCYGVYLKKAAHCVIDTVTVRGASSIGIYLSTGFSNLLSGVDVQGSALDGVCASAGGGVTVINSLVARNKRYGINMTATAGTIVNATVASNRSHQVTGNYGLNVQNSIMVASGYSNYCINVSGGIYVGDYNDFWPVNKASAGFFGDSQLALSDWQWTTEQDMDSISSDPFFVDPAGGDFHLRSMVSSGTYVRAIGAWTNFSEHSACIDAGPVFGSITNEPMPNGGRVNIGADGNTPMASLSNTNGWLLAVSLNDGGVGRGSVELQWLLNGATGSTVSLEYSPDNGTNWQEIASGLDPLVDRYTWLTTTNTSIRALWRVSLGGLTDTVDQVFSLNPHVYYVNDTNTAGDVFCTAAGDSFNRGVSPGAPAISLSKLLEMNTFVPGDLIYVDTGQYLTTSEITFSATNKGTSSSYIVLAGNPDPTNGTVLIGTPAKALIQFVGATYFKVADMTLSNCFYGVSQESGGNCIFSNLNVAAASSAGIRLRSNSNLVSHCRIWAGAGDGILNEGKFNTVDHCAIVNNAGRQLYLLGGSIGLFDSILVAGGSTSYAVYRNSGTYAGNYNDLFVTNGAMVGYMAGKCYYLRDWQAAAGCDSNSLNHDPLFVDAVSGDFHLRSAAPSGTYVNAIGAWTNFSSHSPCIDAGPSFGSVTNEPSPDGGVVNMGPDGDTSMASLSLTNEWLLAVGLNDGGSVTGQVNLTWLSGNIATGTPVDLEYYRGQGDSWQPIVTNLPVETAVYAWTPTNLLGSPLFLWRVISTTATDAVDNVFGIRPYSFYVNDGSLVGDVYCSVTGSLSAAGVSSNQPQASVSSLLSMYDLDGGDTVFIDTGFYPLAQNIEIGTTNGGGAGGYVTFAGSTNGSIFARNSSITGSCAFYLNNVTRIKLADLKMSGGYNCLDLRYADQNIFTNITIGSVSNCGVSLYNSDNNVFYTIQVTNCMCGIYGNGSGNEVRHAVVAKNRWCGISLSSSSSNIIESSTLAFNGSSAGTNGSQLTLLGGNVRNSILAAANGTFCLGPMTSFRQYAGDYNDFFTNGSAGLYPGYVSLSNWQAAVTQDIHSLSEDPCFVDPAGDYHLRSSATNGTYVISLGAWTNFATNSPCIDTGDLTLPCDLEPMPNGGMINIGAFGNTAQASRSVDSDGDGLSDTFEVYARARRWGHYGFIAFGTSPTNADSDGDGMSDFAEFVAGTDPLNSVQCFEVTNFYPVVSNNFILSWASIPQRFYSIQVTTNLMSGFVTVATNLPATPPVNVYTASAAADQSYFKISISR